MCPKCKARTILESVKNSDRLKCPENCGFTITAARMEEIVRDILEDEGRDDEWEEWGQICGGCGKPDPICSCYE